MSKKIIFKFAYPVIPDGGRTANNIKVIGDFSRTVPSHVFFQTTDKDGFAFPYGDVLWKDALTCSTLLIEDRLMAFHATCNVEGFGQVICRADNNGKLYDAGSFMEEDIFLFDVEAAGSEIEDCKKRINRYRNEGIPISIQLENELDIANSTYDTCNRMQNIDDKLKRANKALAKALNINERIEIERAKIRLSLMKEKRAFSFSTFMDGNFEDFDKLKSHPRFKENYLYLFNTGAVSMFWNWTQPLSSKEFDWSIIDKQFNWIEENKLDGIGHCLGWLQLVPVWLKQETDASRIAEFIGNLAEKTIERYGHFVRLWSVMNESHDWFQELNVSYEERLSIFKSVIDRINIIDSKAAVESDTCGVTSTWRMVKKEWKNGAREWYESLDNKGIKDYVIGIQLYNGAGEYPTYDLGRLTKQIEFFSSLGHSVHIYAQTPSGKDPGAWGEINGSWHGEWNEINQALWWENLLTIALSFKEVKGITAVTCMDTKRSWMGYGGFYRSDFSPKPAVSKIKKVLEQYTEKTKLINWK